jgi:exopolyphosphatase / guanosine-5'-triphosphate,3'-diphosphate pyrophosphatase
MNIASIDIGSNTVLLLIAKINSKDHSFLPVINEYRMPRIGKGLTKSKEITSDRIKALNDVLEEYLRIIEENKCTVTLAVGTNALRIALNNNSIITSIKRNLGLDVKIIPGTEEAKLSYLGAISSSCFYENIVIDIGGGSTEIIFGNTDEIKYSKSYQIGVVSLTEKIIKHNPATKDEIENIFKETQFVFSDIADKKFSGTSVIAVAGTPTSLAGIKLKLKKYDELKINNSILTESDLNNFINYFSDYTNEELLINYPVFLSGREDVILAGTIILTKLISVLNIKELTVSTRGIRYGLIVDYINNHLK